MERRQLGALCLIGAPVLYEISRFVWPKGSEGTTAEQLAAAAAHPVRQVLAGGLEAAQGWLLIPAAFAVAAIVVDRGRRLAVIGAVLAVLGGLAFSSIGVLNIVTERLARQPDRARMVQLLDAINKSPYLLPLVILLFAGILGGLLMAIATVRAGLVHWWVLVVVIVGLVLVLGPFSNNTGVIGAVAYLPGLVANGVVGLALYRAVAGAPRRASVTVTQPAVA